MVERNMGGDELDPEPTRPELVRRVAYLEGLIARIHEALGEALREDDDSLPEVIQALIRDLGVSDAD